MHALSSPGRVVTFGELLLRLDTPGYERFVQSDRLGVSFTGGEANVAVALAQWGLSTRVVSKVPGHELGQACVNHLRRYGVDVSHVRRGGERLGILFVETGASQRGPKVVYDRLHTAFRQVGADEFDWDRILHDAAWFHFSGTAPALGDAVRGQLRAALEECRRRQIPVSFDCSYRSTLWTVEEAARILPPLMEFVDVYVGSAQDAATFFDIRETGDAGQRAFQDRYGFRCVAYTDREVTPTGTHRYSAVVISGEERCASPVHEIDVVDRIGTGDAFTAGLIRGCLQKHPLTETVRFAVAAAVLAHSVPGDFALLSVEEIEALAAGAAAGRVQR